MWDKKESGAPRGPQPSAPAKAEAVPPMPSPSASSSPARGRAANIGGSLFIKGEVSGSEDLTVEGRVEGKIDLKDHNLTIAQNGRVNAEIHARSVVIQGEVTGNVHADEKVEIAETGRLVGDLFAPRVAISDGAQFQGNVDMGRTATAKLATSAKESSQARGQTAQRREAQVAAQGGAAG